MIVLFFSLQSTIRGRKQDGFLKVRLLSIMHIVTPTPRPVNNEWRVNQHFNNSEQIYCKTTLFTFKFSCSCMLVGSSGHVNAPRTLYDKEEKVIYFCLNHFQRNSSVVDVENGLNQSTKHNAIVSNTNIPSPSCKCKM